jgi:rRNA biogenesis protein RRP5
MHQHTMLDVFLFSSSAFLCLSLFCCGNLRYGPGFYNGKYVMCRVLPSKKGSSTVEVSLRESRLEGDLDEDTTPETNEIISAYVCETNSKGCFLRLSRSVRGRVILKELSDSFLPDPVALFPMGRLVIGKVKQVHQTLSKRKANTPKGIEATVDIDMRESCLLDQNKVSFEDIQEGSKHKGVVTRVEKYGVFVRLDGSDVTGMAHLSECSDAFVKHLSDLFDPGDRVKVLVLKIDKEQHRISLGLKASYFEGDLCSDSEEQSDEDSSSEEEDRSLTVNRRNFSMDLDSLDSEHENFVSKPGEKTENSGGSTETFDEDVSDDHGDDDSFGDESEIEDTISRDTAQREAIAALDTNVGFCWTSSDGTQKLGEVSQVDEPMSEDDDAVDSSSESSSDENQGRKIGGHKSRRRASQKRKEEKEITMRESALADGTADENPETEKDFERILASQPNMSEYWIKYMA